MNATTSQGTERLKLRVRDGEVGEVKEFYFDDQSWTVQYLIADTGGWLSGRRVLTPPYGLDAADEGWGDRMHGDGAYPTRDRDRWSDASRRVEEDYLHLRSTQDLTGRNIQTQDGETGHVEDCVIDDETWAIRYLIR